MRTDLQKMDRILLVSPAATRWGQKAAYTLPNIRRDYYRSEPLAITRGDYSLAFLAVHAP